MSYFRKDGIKITGKYVSPEGNQYGQRWLEGATDAQLTELGITKHPDPVRPAFDPDTQKLEVGTDGEFYVVTLSPEETEARKPKVASMRQARLALRQFGMLAQVESSLASMPSPQREDAQIEWEYAAAVEKDSPLVQGLAAMLPLTAQQLDDLFELAVTL